MFYSTTKTGTCLFTLSNVLAKYSAHASYDELYFAEFRLHIFDTVTTHETQTDRQNSNKNTDKQTNIQR